MPKILLNRHILSVFIVATFINNNISGRFVIERNEKRSDRLIKIDGADEVQKDESTFKADGTCLDARRNIASAITDAITRCYTNTEIEYIGTEQCSGGFAVVGTTDTDYPFRYTCKVKKVQTIMLWNPNGWKDFNYESDDFLKAELKYKENGDLMFKQRANWNGILMRFITSCHEGDDKCITLKFTGNRTYPIPDNLEDILVTKTTTTTTTTTTPTTPPQPPPTTTTTTTTKAPTTATQRKIVERQVTQSVVLESKEDDKATGGKSLGAGLIIGVIMSMLIFFALALALFLYLKRRRNADKRKRLDSNIYATADNVYEVTNNNEKGVMITTGSYATPGNSEPKYWELEPEYDRPVTLSSPERAYDVPRKNADNAPRSRHHVSASASHATESSEEDGFYYDTPADNNTTTVGRKQNVEEQYAKIQKHLERKDG